MQRKLKKNGNGNGHHDKNGGGNALKVGLLVVAVALIGFLLFRLVQRFAGPRQEVWVASSALEPETLIGDGDLELRSLRNAQIPPGAIFNRRNIVGRFVTRALEPGDVFVRGTLRSRSNAEEQAQYLAELLPPGRVLTKVLVDLDSVIMHNLKFGDRFELVSLAAGRGGRGGARARVVASDAFFLAWVDPQQRSGSNGGGNGDANGSGNDDRTSSRAGLLSGLLADPLRRASRGPVGTSRTKLLLALHPRDVLPVAEASSGGSRSLSLVLHGKREVEEGRMATLPSERRVVVDLISGAKRERIPFLQ